MHRVTLLPKKTDNTNRIVCQIRNSPTFPTNANQELKQSLSRNVHTGCSPLVEEVVGAFSTILLTRFLVTPNDASDHPTPSAADTLELSPAPSDCTSRRHIGANRSSTEGGRGMLELFPPPSCPFSIAPIATPHTLTPSRSTNPNLQSPPPDLSLLKLFYTHLPCSSTIAPHAPRQSIKP